MTAITEVKERIAAEVARSHPQLVNISHTLHAHPEILFQEHESAALLTETLAEHGFAVERGVAGLNTAFVATFGSGTPVVGLLAEYDALPKLGHACGHNLIATWAVGAGIALRRALPAGAGTVKVIGCPAEEGGGGKVTLADAGVFDGLDAAMMIHPRDTTYLDRASLALTPLDVEFFGKAAHAAAFPERGINALDVMLHLFFGVNALRQSLKEKTRIHGIITHGGEAANIIPAYTACHFLLRAREQPYLEEVKARFLAIVRGAELATGCTAKVTEGIGYPARVCNTALVETFGENVVARGLTHEIPPPDVGVGSSDIGRVSQLVPTIHPYLQICDPPVGAHTTQFAEAANTPRADATLADGATLLAWTAADVLLRPEVRERLHESFRAQLGRDPQA